MTALAGSGPDAASFPALANSMDGSDGLFEPLFLGETKIAPAYQIQTKPLETNRWLNFMVNSEKLI